MKKSCLAISLGFIVIAGFLSAALAQEKKLDKIRVGGGSASATQMTLWLAKEGNLYEKHGIAAEVISIPGSSLALQAMLSGEVPIIQLGGAASVQAGLSGADTIIIATIVRRFLFSIFSRPGLERMEDLKGKIFGTTRFGTLSELASRFALQKFGIDPDRDVTMVQTGGQPETVTALATGKIQAAALSPPATLHARKLKLRELLDISKLEADFHVNGVVTSRRYMKTNEDIVRRFLKAYIEAAALARKDKSFAFKVMGKYFRTDDRDILEESYDSVLKSNLSIPPYPSVQGIVTILQSIEKQNPKAKGAKAEEFYDSRLVKELEQTGFIKSVLP
ncbi:MAG TPA: ABC transporter substrate-binding protein [Candidatus Binatia bacterium]|jgi:NitT/TauT family transport system substrate-binding protein|nr:ABC transporter substrate-binding protein [Candidatus Binatia bacterium]